MTFDQRTPLQLRRALGDAENALANERAKVVRLQAQIERLERVAAKAYDEGYQAGFDACLDDQAEYGS